MEFPKERTRVEQVFTFPEQGRTVQEDPPCFCWIPAEGEREYTVRVLCDGEAVFEGRTRKNYIVPPQPLGEGEYTWDVSAEGAFRGEIGFSIAKGAKRINRVSAHKLFELVPDERPRHLFFSSDVEALVREKQGEIAVLRRNVALAKKHGSPEPPAFHRDPNATPYREYFGAFRDYVDRDLVALSLAYALLGDKEAAAAAKKLLLDLCDISPLGPMSLEGPFGDELGLSMARCLPAVFDLLYSFLDSKERMIVARTVRIYGMQCYDRLKKLNYCENPGNSHAGRLPAYMGEAAMVLKGTGVQPEREALEWLDYALEIYGGIFPYYGTPDGGWAEGPFYCTSYTKWYLPFFSAVERYGGTAFLDRPFYGNLTEFLLHFADPAAENHPFGDGYWSHPEDKEWPGFFAQDPYRYYCDRFADPIAKKRSLSALPKGVYLLHLLDVFLPVRATKAVKENSRRDIAVFGDAGFVAMHTAFDSAEDLALLARASRFGSDSHRHADQGSFAIFHRGNAMVSPSGYFGRAYGTEHHQKWTVTTKAHNTILVDGVGQEVKSVNSKGRIVRAEEKDGKRIAVLDISDAYPSLKSFVRTLTLEDGRVTVEDNIVAYSEVEIMCPIHTLSMPKEENGIVCVERGGSHMRIACRGITLESISDEFDVPLNTAVPDAYAVEMPPQFHLYYLSSRRKKHSYSLIFEIS